MVLPRSLFSLGAKLALLFLALGLPVLVVVEALNLVREQRHLVRDVDDGALTRAAAHHAQALAPRIGSLARDPVAAREALDVIALRLAQPDSGLSPAARYFLMEIEGEPLRLRLFDARGRELAATPGGAPAAAALVEAALRGDSAAVADDRDGALHRTALVPILAADGTVSGALQVALELPPPWRTLASKTSAEWPVMFACLLVLALATYAFFARGVARRIERVAEAAERWRSGDLRGRVDARSRDELGRLGARLNEMAAQLEDHLATRARVASLEERQRLARDLHDTVKQKVFALNLQLATAATIVHQDGAEAGKRLREAEQLIAAIQSELATILVELRDGDAVFALGPALRTLADDWSRRSGIEAEWERCDDAPLPRWIGDQALKLAEEALSNVLRHSGATRARLALVDGGERYTLSVADDGRGFDDAPPGMGLDNMRVRVGALPSGSLDIDSGAGRGTRIVARWRSVQAAA